MAAITFSSHSALHRHAIVLFADATYLPFAHWTAQGLLAHGAGAAADMVILSPDIAGLEKIAATGSQARLVGIADSFTPFGFTDVPDDFPSRSYLNLFAPDIFASDYARIILCDSDYVIGNADMPRLFDMNMKAYPVAAMRDIIGLTPALAAANEQRYFEPASIRPSTPYLNGGFQLIDVQPWLNEEIGARALASTLARGGPKWLGDQRALNAVLRGDWMELSPNCNWAAIWPGQSPVQGQMAARRFSPCGLHLLGAAKPWSTKRPRRIDPDIASAMQVFFDASPWPGLIPSQRLTGNVNALEALSTEVTAPVDLFPDHGIYTYLTGRFEDVLQEVAPAYQPQRWFPLGDE